jgi:hypothetical protein
MLPTNGPASNTRSRSAPVQQIPPFRQPIEEEDISVASTTILHRDTTLVDLLQRDRQNYNQQNNQLPTNNLQQYSLTALSNQQDTRFLTPTIVPPLDQFQNISPIQPSKHSSPHMMDGYFDNTSINNFRPGLHDQSMQYPLDQGFDGRNPGFQNYPTQYAQPMYSTKIMQSYQDYAYPQTLPTGQNFQSHPHLQQIYVPEIFRTNRYYLWGVKEYSINKVTSTLLAALAKSDLKSIASVDSTAFLQLRDLLFVMGNLTKLTQYWFGISKISFHPETIPYENKSLIYHNLLNCTNYIFNFWNLVQRKLHRLTLKLYTQQRLFMMSGSLLNKNRQLILFVVK